MDCGRLFIFGVSLFAFDVCFGACRREFGVRDDLRWV